MTTTIKISRDDLPWWKDCCRAYRMSSQEVFHLLRQKVQEHKRQEFYRTLPMPHDFRKKLFGKHIDKTRIADKVYGKVGSQKM